MRNSRSIIMKDKEFAIMSVLCGLNHFFGDIHIEYEKLNKQEIYTTFYRLYTKGFLRDRKNGITLCEEIKGLFKDLKRAERLMRIVNLETSENYDFYYLRNEEMCINLQKGLQEPESIKIRRVHKKDVIDICNEAQIFPRQILDEKLMAHITLAKQDRLVKEYLEISVYELMGEEKMGEITVRMEGLNDVILYSSNDETYKELYVLDHLKQKIVDWIEED